MRKFIAARRHEKLLVLGLTEADVKQLKAGQLLAVDLGQLGLPWQGQVMLFYGKTDYDMRRQLPDDDDRISEARDDTDD
jgi:hypothetical protein